MARQEFNFICRLCIQKIETEKVSPIFSDETFSDFISLSEKIKFCSSVEVTKGDGLPSQICSACLFKLNQSFVFRNQCVLADVTLKHLLSDLNCNLDNLPSLQKINIENQIIYGSSGYDTVKNIFKSEEMISEMKKKVDLEENDLKNSFSLEEKKEIVENEEILIKMNQLDSGTNSNTTNELFPQKTHHQKKKKERHKKEDYIDSKCTVNTYKGNKIRKQSVFGSEMNLGTNLEKQDKSFMTSFNISDNSNENDQIKEENLVENQENNVQKAVVKQTVNKLPGRRGRTKKLNKCPKPSSYKCNYCNKIYPSEGGWRYHVHTMHSENYQPFICDLCGQPFKVKKNLESHKNSIHFHLKLQVCDLCGRGFASKYALKVHKIWHSDEKNFGCEICGTKFRTRGKLNTHKSIHGGPKKFMCHVCSRNFRWKKDFEFHMRTHTGEKPFKCSICCKAFASLSNMKKHEKNHKKSDAFDFSEKSEFMERSQLQLNAAAKENRKAIEKVQKNEEPDFIYFSPEVLSEQINEIS